MVTVDSLLIIVGGLTVVKVVFSVVIPLLLNTICSRAVDFSRLEGGKWAVVTGATDGIGKAMAVSLAKRGMSIVLVSRTQSRLDAAAAECSAANPDIETRTIQVDFSKPGDGIFEKLASELSGLQIGVLINNVGVSYPHAQYLTEVTDELLDALSTVNVQAMMRLTKIVLAGGMRFGGGVIVNVASAAGIISSDPLYAGYAGSKAFVDSFSRSLSVECAEKNVVVQCHVPLFVATKLAKIRRTSFFVPSAEAYAEAAINSIVRGGSAVTIVPYWTHRIQLAALQTLVPAFAWARYKFQFGLSIRKRALAKAGKRSRERSRSPKAKKKS